MTTLVAVAFPYETTASAAAEDVRWLALDILLEADAIAVISCDRTGVFHVTTNHPAAGDGAARGVCWHLLFSMLFFVPSFDMDVGGDLDPLLRGLAQAGIDEAFQGRLRDLLQPGTSALFLALDPTVPAGAVEELTRFGGTVVKSTLSAEAESVLQRARCRL